jgi:RimJ/RimL family protein N-acetyltransferase
MAVTLYSLGEGLLPALRRWPHLQVAPGALPPDALLAMAERDLQAGKPAIWHAPFLFVDEQGVVVGSGGFKGLPREGRVEIGYGVASTFRGRGFATTAVEQLLGLAFAQVEIVGVVAETATDNLPSQRVLQKLGFGAIGRRDCSDDGPLIVWNFDRQEAGR